MKALYFILGLLFGVAVGFSVSCLQLQRPACYEDQFLIKDFSGEYSCINIDDVPINAKST
jgi:hypothetical protein